MGLRTASPSESKLLQFDPGVNALICDSNVFLSQTLFCSQTHSGALYYLH